MKTNNTWMILNAMQLAFRTAGYRVTPKPKNVRWPRVIGRRGDGPRIDCSSTAGLTVGTWR